MTPEQEAAAEMREKAAREAMSRKMSSGDSDAYWRGYANCADVIVAAIRELPLPEAKPDPRDTALAKAREALDHLSVKPTIRWEADMHTGVVWRTHVINMTEIAKEAMAAIESALKGGVP